MRDGAAVLPIQAYTTPVYFREDWLYAYYDLRAAERRQCSRSGSDNSSRSSADKQPVGTDVLATSDYRFVYLGPKVCPFFSSPLYNHCFPFPSSSMMEALLPRLSWHGVTSRKHRRLGLVRHEPKHKLWSGLA